MNTDIHELLDAMRRRPAVHRLAYGAFIQGHLWFDEQTLIVPLTAMGFDHGVEYAVKYYQQILGCPPDEGAVAGLREQARYALPVLAFIHFQAEDEPAAMAAASKPVLDRAEQIVGWISGDYLTEFANLIVTNERAYFNVVPPHSNQRLLLGPGNVGASLVANIKAISSAADADERFAFALGMYRDALHEKNEQFKIVRLFNVLEGLAYALKESNGSRSAIRKMLELEAGAVSSISYAGGTIRYERIELAGRLRVTSFTVCRSDARTCQSNGATASIS